jgi:acyl-CoA thioester hydrolase
MSSPNRPYRAVVPPDWIDYNGHMNVAYYVLAFDRATDRLLDQLGLGEAYRRATNCSIFALEAHICYLSELRQGDEFAIETRLIDADRKRLHLFHAMTKTGAEGPAATLEAMALHVDLAGPKSAPIGDDAFAKITALLAQHRGLPAPPQLGHRIAIRR